MDFTCLREKKNLHRYMAFLARRDMNSSMSFEGHKRVNRKGKRFGIFSLVSVSRAISYPISHI